MSSGDGPLGPGFRFLPADGYSSRYLRCLSKLWNFSSVEGWTMTAARLRWRGLRNSDQKPNWNRSSTERLGARCRERSIIRSCCFTSRLSATTAFAPLGPRSLAMVVNKCARRTNRSFMAEQGRDDCVQEQDWLSLGIQVITNNSPGTGYSGTRQRSEYRCQKYFPVDS